MAGETHISDDNAEEENRRLRRTMRDLVAISTLPAIWTGLGPEGIARSLADVLFTTLSLDLLYVRLRGLLDERVIEVLRTEQSSDESHNRTIKTLLAHIVSGEAGDPPISISNPFGAGTLNLAVTRFGIAGDEGVVITGSLNAEFPSERDRLLLGVGANQTTIIVQRMRAEAQHQEQAQRLRTTLASIGDGVITTDTKGCCTNLNAVAESLTGWTNAEANGQPLDVVFHIVNETTRLPVANPATRALEVGAIVGLANHTILIAKDGTERPIDDSAAPIRCKEGEIVGCVLVFRDVSEKRQAELALQESERNFRLLFEQAVDGIFVTDPEGRYVDVNVAACKMLGFAREEIVGQTIADIVMPEEIPRIQPELGGLLMG